MNKARFYLIISAGAFAVWIGYLGYLAATTRRPIVLSQPQFLISEFDISAEVTDADKPAKVTKIFHAASPEQENLEEVLVQGLKDCDGWTGPGNYLLPLVHIAGNAFQVAGIPRSPGSGDPKPRIYPDTPKTREQMELIKKPK
jgi:hypothetical protein